jgi:cellulose synthase/poly-beta-1,6-N-acetylglucosamine synthase-like glycosyltransferase
MGLALQILCWGIVGIFFSIQIFSLIAQFLPNKKPVQTFEAWPKVSILLAARNEAKTIERCLQAFSRLDYPTEQLEILIGNDASEDSTKQRVEKFIKDKPNFKLFDIETNLGKALGKANVLAHLAHKATGEFYFITDSDVAVPKGWIKSLLSSFTPEVGIASGTTTCQGGNWAANLQSVDWLHFMGYIKSFANVGVSSTSVGNNMAVRAEAYWQTGGYETIDFSITEDYKLFKEVTSRGWEWHNLLNPETLGLATHISSFSEIMHQRKRWLMGANELPLNWKFLLVIYGLFIPVLLVFGYFNIVLALKLWTIKFALQSLFIVVLVTKAKLKFKDISTFYIGYELYLIFMTLITSLFYLLPVKSIWKGRLYTQKGLSK